MVADASSTWRSLGKDGWLESLPREMQKKIISDLKLVLFDFTAVRMQERVLEFEPKLQITHKLYQQSWTT